ncbi:FRG1 family protein [Schizosaccharomyces cryophilus OY26]|uniref:FRG1 family protein n=1 Tax=Schizosaccharomyces cryophilus (strain OY26 / ATCC MYA-4695 / CBS 11777 / NBRC 106824 / NRRL Y48691) TaxID=653667 RepID=S9W270_SCHCR|nr:FRG1 family protein [Schizosaccharomyces cryophilus OY26]EPY54138.1 FRG1 family protein [Schizosaccharomyces cryophilus OY26]
MPSRLSFKGDKKVYVELFDQIVSSRFLTFHFLSVKKKSKKSSKSLKSAVESQENDPIWTDAILMEDLHGPLVLYQRLDTTVISLGVEEVQGSCVGIFLDPLSLEPDNTRQVFVASDMNGNIVLKSFLLKYLSVGKEGDLFSRREAIGAEEQWVLEYLHDGYWAWKSMSNNKYLECLLNENDTYLFRCTSDTVTFTSKWRVRVQTRFLKRSSTQTIKKPTVHSEQLEAMAGRPLSAEEKKTLKQASKDGSLHEALLDLRVSKKSDKYG